MPRRRERPGITGLAVHVLRGTTVVRLGIVFRRNASGTRIDPRLSV